MNIRRLRNKVIGFILLFGLFLCGLILAMVDEAKFETGPLVFSVRCEKHASLIPSEIYGLAAAPESVLVELQVPLNRWGGNTASRYNWELGNAWNTGRDWFFENVAVEDRAWENFIDQSLRSDSMVIMTLPLVGYVAKDTTSCSFSIKKYGPQQKFDTYRPDAGNGIRPDGSPLTGNDPLDVSIACESDFVEGWVVEMVKKYPDMFEKKKVIFALGNEPMLWNIVHRDVHPQPTSYDEILARFKEMAQAVKKIVPDALIAGPELWGWPAYFQSAVDRERGCKGEMENHGHKDFLPWFLEELKKYEDQTGQRLLDYVTVHFYPQAEAVYSPCTDEKTRKLRLESTRSLFDPAYRDPSWIGQPIQLIPQLKKWVTEHYPGIKVAVTEYNWGGEKDMSGAMALADILGIFGRDGLDLACYWTYPPQRTPAYWAYAIYRNVDGHGARFGDMALKVVSANRRLHDWDLSLYAALDKASRVVSVVAINKSTAEKKVLINFEDLPVSSGRGYFLVEPGLEISTMKNPVPVNDSKAMLLLSPYAIYHFRFPVN